ncbi:SDR family NAD(P)-dependent oxidoreductase [Bradyrhizobium sp. USDA 4473]
MRDRQYGPLEEFSLENKTIAVNLTGVFLGMQAALPAIRPCRRRPDGQHFVGRGGRGSAGLNAYRASKFGVRSRIKSAALEAAASGVGINSIRPGFIATR